MFDLCVLCGLLDLGCCLIRLIVLLLVTSFSFVVLLDYVCGGVYAMVAGLDCLRFCIYV